MPRPTQAASRKHLEQELAKKTAELSESLQQQVAAAEVLKTISRSVFDLQSVLDTLTSAAARLCDAEMVSILRHESDGFRYETNHGIPPEHYDFIRSHEFVPGRGSVAGRVMMEGRSVQIEDARTDRDFLFEAARTRLGFRTILGVPMVRDGNIIGILILMRKVVRPFSANEIRLVETFADQAVIAIENVRLFKELQRSTQDLRRSLDQQTATSAILRVIARSPTDIEPVLRTLAENAARVCGADDAHIFRVEGEDLKLAASFGPIPVYFSQQKISRDWVTGRAVVDRRTIHIADLAQEPESEFPIGRQMQRMHGHRTTLATPLLRQGEPLGAILIRRMQVQPFTDEQIGVLESFADQAVIAIENVRLFDEVTARTHELTQALEFQTATSEVLGVISRSPNELQPVLDAIVGTAARLCRASHAMAFMLKEDGYHLVASNNAEDDFIKYALAHPHRLDMRSVTAQSARTGQTVHVVDVLDLPDYNLQEYQRVGNYRTVLAVPLLRDGKPIGVIDLLRSEVDPFTPRQISLVETFADQAIIAIENARLFDEVQSRTREVQEALDYQTAASEVLGVISRSAFEVTRVFQAVGESALRLCEADKAFIFRFEDGVLRAEVALNASPQLIAFIRDNPIRPGRHSASARAALERKTVHIEDAAADPEYTYGARDIDPLRTNLSVPILKGDKLLGVITIYRLEVQPFSAKQIALLETFADQAAIAIENAGLFDEVQSRTREVQEALDYQTASSEVLGVISRSAATAQGVLDAIVETFGRVCHADLAFVFMRGDDGLYHIEAVHPATPRHVEFLRKNPIRPGRGTTVGRALLERRTIHIPDAAKDQDYAWSSWTELSGACTFLAVPLLSEGEPVGVISAARTRVNPFTERQIDLIETFADQAVIAIQNAELFAELQQRTRELAASLDELQRTQDRLVQTEKLASLGQLTAGIAHEIKNPLNFVNNFSALSTDLLEDLTGILGALEVPPERRAEIEEIASMLRGNLERVIQHGRRADSIVKNMLLHSRMGSGEHRATDINALVEESLNLAYHGVRAERPGFNVTLHRSLAPDTGLADVYPQEITRALLNLIANGFHAAAKRGEGAGAGHKAMLEATTASLGDSVEIRIRDNGTGIPLAARDKMFIPFFTTKPPGEGTGLGLSITHDIVVTQHGGKIDVETEEGAFTEFRIVLPRNFAPRPEKGTAS